MGSYKLKYFIDGNELPVWKKWFYKTFNPGKYGEEVLHFSIVLLGLLLCLFFWCANVCIIHFKQNMISKQALADKNNIKKFISFTKVGGKKGDLEITKMATTDINQKNVKAGYKNKENIKERWQDREMKLESIDGSKYNCSLRKNDLVLESMNDVNENDKVLTARA